MFKNYRKGLLHGLPIALGYLSVSFAFGISAVRIGLTPLQATLISLTNLTSAGQLAGLDLMACGGTLAEMALTQLTINIRYSLMSVSLSQKLDESMTLVHRAMIAFGNTDEVFAVASQQPGKLGRAYLHGLIHCPIIGWTLGTLLGAVAGNILPSIVTNALGIAIYAMFIAIVLPPFREKLSVRIVVLVAVSISLLLHLVPFFSFLSAGFRIIVCALIGAALGAWLFPCPDDEKKEDEP